MGKIKILLILEATAGGTRRYITQVLMHLDLEKFEPVLFCSTMRDPAFMDDIGLIKGRGIKVRIFPMKREISPFSDLMLIYRIAGAIREEKPDIVHTHSSKAGIIGRIAARKTGVAKIAHTPHVFPFEMDLGELRSSFYLLLERIAAKRTSLLIAVSNAEKSVAIEKGLFNDRNSVVNYNGIEPELWLPVAAGERDKLRKQAGIPQDVFVVGMVGRFMPQKGHRILVEAARSLLEKNKDIHFVLVGDGELKDEIRSSVVSFGIERNFHFLDQTDKIAQCYAIFDCLLMPSLWEGCPFTAMEAMAMGVPVVATAVGGVKEIIEDNVSGILVPPADAASLAQAVGKLCEDRMLRENLAEKGRRKVLEKFLLSESIRRLEDTYQKMYQTQEHVLRR